jgi:predicted transcriptional regulator
MREAAALTELQLAVLGVLWDLDEATTQDVWQRVGLDRGLALTTVATILSRLERRGILTYRRVGRQHVHRALVTRAQVRTSKIRELTEVLFDGDPVKLLGHVVESGEIGPEGARRLRAVLRGAD